METKKYLMGGKIGDFIHSLAVSKFIFDTKGYKADILLNNFLNLFETSLERTYLELKPILLSQTWINNFTIHNNQNWDYNLNDFRDSPFLYQTNWTRLFFKTFLHQDDMPHEFSWLEMPKDLTFANTLLVTRKHEHFEMTKETIYKYESIFEKYTNKRFIFFNEKNYENFPLKNKIEPLHSRTLYDFFQKINGCKCLLSNQTGPFAWASALNVPRILELSPTVDAVHYISDKNYYKNFDCF